MSTKPLEYESFNRIDSDSESSQELRRVKKQWRGHEVEEDPIIPGIWKIGMVFGSALTATVVTLTILTALGHLDLNLNWLGFSSLVFGAAEVGRIVVLCRHYQSESKARAAINMKLAKQRFQAEQQERMGVPPKSKAAPRREILSSDDESSVEESSDEAIQKKKPTPPTADEWEARLKAKPAQGTLLYNLDQVDEPLNMQTKCGVPLLPVLGQYSRSKDSYGPESVIMAAKLPSAHIACFPEPIANWLTQDDETEKTLPAEKQNVECLVMFFDNTTQKETFKRNLSLHMLLPEYDMDDPAQYVGGNVSSVDTETFKGLKTNMQISMYAPEGIIAGKQKGAILKNKICDMEVQIHGEEGEYPRLSPNNAYFHIHPQAEVSQAYFGVKSRGRNIAIRAIILNKKTGAGKALSDAFTPKDNAPLKIEEFLNAVEEDETLEKMDIRRSFTHPNLLFD